jgi:hypothetical protein
VSPGNAAVTRFRHHPARAIAGVVVAISLTSLTAVSPWYALLVALPAAYTVWVWRSGTDADRAGVRVRIPWSEITTMARVPGDRVVATLRGGGAVLLTAVTPDALPRLVAASGGRISEVGAGISDAEVTGNPANGRYDGAVSSD